MKLNTRDDLARYAMELSIPLMERTAERRLNFYRTEVNDSAGYNLTLAENFCRPLWGIAPVLKEGSQPFFLQIKGERTEICDWIRRVVSEAADETSIYRWRIAAGQDPSSYYNQLKTELAGLMTGIWIAREKLWEPYEESEKQKIAQWVYEVNRLAYQDVWDCNHIWFIVLNLTILKALGYPGTETDHIVREGLGRLDRMYTGYGFYQDGQFGRFDYYGPWAMHFYPLLWCMVAEGIYEDCQIKKAEYKKRTDDFLNYYSHMFDANGCHIPFGRSLSYRFAACALFPVAVLSGCNVSYGLARRIMFRNINYFREQSELQEGIFPPGFLYLAPQIVEGYTSDGGSYWCTKAFLALLMPKEHSFWTVPEELMPSERGAFICDTGHPAIHMPISCDCDGSVILYNNTAHYLQNHKKTQWFLDMAGFYSKFAYHSRSGFGISTRDSVSFDNMISLVTPDGTMESHRFGFEDLGNRDGVLKSRHIPFSNDPHTSVTSWIVILPDGVDVRIHQVVLNQAYGVREGSFPVPVDDDRRIVERSEGFSVFSWPGPVKSISVEAAGLKSTVIFAGDTVLAGTVCQIQPGMNLMKPMAYYPGYTSEILEKGEYLFLSVHCLTTKPNSQRSLPEIRIIDRNVTVKYRSEIGVEEKKLRLEDQLYGNTEAT